MSKVEHFFISDVKNHPFPRPALYIDTKDIQTSIKKIISYYERKLYQIR